MSLRSPLARVRGLGAAKDGTGHWWMQRLTSVALVPLSLVFVFLVMAFKGADHGEVVALMGHPTIAVAVLLFVVAGFWHLKLGVQVVIEDYIHHESAKTVSLVVVSLASFALATACVFAVLKLAFGG